MYTNQDREHMRLQISYLEVYNQEYRNKGYYNGQLDSHECGMKPEVHEYYQLMHMKPSIPLPEYALNPNLIGTQDTELNFYLACQDGLVQKVDEFIESQSGSMPSQAIRQYGLQVAAFANQVATVGHLLQKWSTILHCQVFYFCLYKDDGKNEGMELFQHLNHGNGSDDSSLPMLQMFIDSGCWHPNQNISTTHLRLEFALLRAVYLKNRALIHFLLVNGANPHLGTEAGSYDSITTPITLHSGEILDTAIRILDPELLRLLMSHGANPTLSRHLMNLAVDQTGRNIIFGPRGANSFVHSGRQSTAEYLLSLDGVDVNDVKLIPFRLHPWRKRESTTALAEAVHGQDWDFARWLLEHGADPDLLNGKAYEQRYVDLYIKSTLADIEPFRKLVVEVQEQLAKASI